MFETRNKQHCEYSKGKNQCSRNWKDNNIQQWQNENGCINSFPSQETKYDLLLFLVAALFWKVTPILPTYLIGIARMICTHLILTLHYIFVTKDNYDNKLTQKQVIREREDYLIGIAHDGKLPLVLFAVVSLVNNCFVFSTHLHIE